MSYIPEYHENYYRVEGTAFNQGKIGIGTINPVQLLHVSGGNFRLDGTGYVNGDLNVTGNLNVYGSTAQFAVSQVIAEDKSIELNAATGSPIGGGSYTTSAFTDDAGADEGGLVLKSTQGDKVILYETVTPASGWVSNLRWVVSGNYGKNTLQLSDATANVGMTIGTDGNNVNLYRSGNNTLRTDDSLGVVLNFNVDGNTTLGDATSDTISFNARANTSLEPSSNNAVNLGSSALNWGTAFLNTLQVAANSTLTGNLNVNGNTTLGDTTSDTVIFTARSASNIIPSTNNSVNLGTSALNWSTGYLDTLSGSYIRLNNSPVIINSGTTGEALLHLRANSTRPILAQSEFSGVTFSYQPSLIDKNSILHLYPRNGVAVTDHFGWGTLNTVGVATARAVTGTNFYAATKRIAYTTTTLGQAVGFRDDGFPQWMRGGSGFGGFYLKSRFGIGRMDAAISGRSRGFIGVTSLIGNILSNNPSTRGVDMLGIGFDSGDSTWSFLHGSGSNNSTKIPLRNYDCTISSGNFIEFTMYAIPSSGVGFHANIANSGNTFSTGYYATTNLPALGTMMVPNASLYHPNGIPSVSGIALDMNGFYIESYR
jgi:hypothetical protein